MSIKKVVIILGEPNSTFSEILLKYFNSNNFKKTNNKIILIGSFELFNKQMKFLKYKNKLNEILDISYALRRKINIINVNYKFNKVFSNISDRSNKYIENCFKVLKSGYEALMFCIFVGCKEIIIKEYKSKKFFFLSHDYWI